jgi:hypothetical protein
VTKLKTKKIVFKYSGAAVVIILLIINTSALTSAYIQEENRETKSSVKSRDVFVDSHIYIAKTKLPLLQRSLKYIENIQIKQLIQEVVAVLTTKEYVSSNDIREIIIRLDLRNLKVHTGFLNSYGESLDDPGSAVTFPGYLITNLELFRTGSSYYIGPAIIGFWQANDDAAYTTVNFWKKYSGIQSGYIIGFCGVAENNLYGSLGFFDPFYSIYGTGALIIISKTS